MTWLLLIGLVGGLGLALLSLWSKRRALRTLRGTLREREQWSAQTPAGTLLQHPVIDLTRCLGCGTCVAACPEEGVLELVHGQAAVVRGARCVGTAACARECPTGAITVTLSDLGERRDVPVLDERLEAVGRPGLFLAGEVTAHALIKTAVEHGSAVAAEVARRVRVEPSSAAPLPLDLLIVGAGPAGLACALEAKARGLRFLVVDQERHPGGTVAKYPRRKLVLTQPVELPLHGRLKQPSYTKEELIELWHGLVAEHQLPIRCGVVFEGLEAVPEGGFQVFAGGQVYGARCVCLAIGRRGSPRRLGIPGEDLPKVTYGLLDAAAYRDRRLLVVGGGDSAVETALGLAEQPGNRVTLAYRGSEFYRLKSRNAARLAEARSAGRLEVLVRTELRAVTDGEVELELAGDPGPRRERRPNDEVFVLAGGRPPIPELERAGVSFDPRLRPPPVALGEQGSGLLRALAVGLVLALGTLAFALYFRDYYTLPTADRPSHPLHDLLRPGLGFGLACGVLSTVLIAVNLSYLLRRSRRAGFRFGALPHWLSAHVATGLLALLTALLHGALAPGDSVGGQAFWVLVVLCSTGALGRYLYAYLPRAANGRELELSEVRSNLASLAAGFDGAGRHFGERVRAQIEQLIAGRRWGGSAPARLAALCGAEFALRRSLHRLRREGLESGLDAQQVDSTLGLARQAHRAALLAAHLEDLRGLLASWRWLHRWGALLLVLLLVLHVVYALLYSARFFDGGLT